MKAHAQRQAGRHNAEGVIHREYAGDSKPYRHLLSLKRCREADPLCAEGNVPRCELRILLCGIPKDGALLAFHHECAALIVDVDPAGFAVREDFLFCRRISFHGAVQIKMILREVGKHCHIKVDACHASELQRVGRDFHHHMGAALIRHLFEKLVQLQTLGGGVFGMEKALADHISVCADEPNLCPQLCFQHMFENICGTGLAAGSGKAHELHAGSRISIEVAACEGKTLTAVCNFHIRCAVCGRVLTQYRRSSVCHGLWDETMPVGLKSLDGDKEITGLCLAGIIADAADCQRGVGGAFQNFYMFEKLSKLHGISLR